MFINKNARKIIEKSMSKHIRREYKNGKPTNIIIVREQKNVGLRRPLQRYGDYIKIRISKCGKYITSDMEQYEESDVIVNDIIGYFMYGEKDYDYTIYCEDEIAAI